MMLMCRLSSGSWSLRHKASREGGGALYKAIGNNVWAGVLSGRFLMEVRGLPRYFLHIVTLSEGIIEDLEGFDLPDIGAARREALAGAGEIIAHAIKAGRDLKDEAILITDEQGRELERVDFIEAIPASLKNRLRRT